MVPSGVILFYQGLFRYQKGNTGGSPWLPSPRQSNTKRAGGLSATPSRTTEKKGIPRLSPVTESANRSRVCTKRVEPWGCPGTQQNKAFKEQKRCTPLFPPGHRLKYRSKAIKTGKPQKNTACFSFFYIMHKITILPETKQGCNYR